MDQNQTNLTENFENKPLQNSTNVLKQSTEVLSVKDWLITFLISAIPLAGFIMLLVWAFSDSENVNKTNWAKAQLLFMAIMIAFFMVLYIIIIFFVFAGAGMSGAFNN